jgi:hypothetical protein
VAAAGQAEVVAGDPQPLVLVRRGQHPLQQLLVAGLELALLSQGEAGVLDLHRERVADDLQLAEVERPRLTREGGHARANPQTREGLGGERPQLSFEAADLAPQLDPGEALLASCPQRTSPISFEQLGHTRPECRSPGRSERELGVKRSRSHSPRKATLAAWNLL